MRKYCMQQVPLFLGRVEASSLEKRSFIIVVDSQKFSTQIQIASETQAQNRIMLTFNHIFANAKKSIELLETYPLHLEAKNNIKKLKEILDEEEYQQLLRVGEEVLEATSQEQRRQALNYQLQDRKEESSITKNLQERQDEPKRFLPLKDDEEEDPLERIVEDIQQLLSMKDEQTSKNIESSHLSDHELKSETMDTVSTQEIYSLLIKLTHDITTFIKIASRTSPNENNSNCSYNTHPNCNTNSNSGSVRSLLTEKLRQLQEDFDDPEYNNERVVIQGNLMRDLRVSKPLIVSRRYEDLSEPFSMQHKPYNEKQLQNLPKKRQQKGRVHSQRTILGQINLSESHFHEKRAKKDETGCSRCEIY